MSITQKLKAGAVLALLLVAVAGGLWWQRKQVLKYREKAEAQEAEALRNLAALDRLVGSHQADMAAKDKALKTVDKKLREKARELDAAVRKMDEQARVVSQLRAKESKVTVVEVPAPCEECFAEYEKPVTVSLKSGTTLYHDPNCLDDDPGELRLKNAAAEICSPYQTVTREIVIGAIDPGPPPFAEFTNENQAYGTVATDGFHVGYDHDVVRIGPVHIVPTAEARFDHRDGSIYWYAGIKIPVDLP